MKQLDHLDRNQMMMTSLELMVDQNSMVRVVDVFLDFADDTDLGFASSPQKTGRPAFPVRTLIGIYVYGYLNKVRSSRDLAKACKTNIELWWLLKGHKPCYKTIADFRKNNSNGFRNLFKKFRSFCESLELYGKQTIAIDGSKFRAQNAMKNNFNNKKIDRHLEYIENKQAEYLKSLDQQDSSEDSRGSQLDDRLSQLSERKLKYTDLKEKLKNSGETQISTTDSDARALPIKMSIVEVAYNLQSAVDDKHNLIVEYEITNKNDYRALAPMALKAKNVLNLGDEDSINVLADKGYHTGDQLNQCHNHNIKTVVAIPRKPKQTDRTKPAHLRKENFTYNSIEDTYTCPNLEVLTKQARYKRKTKSGFPSAEFDRYTIKNSICNTCQFYEQCISKSNRKSSQGRYIDRYLTDQAIQQNKINVENNQELYKRRQAIVEHPFGTIKRGWGFTHTLMKTIPKVQTEFSIIMLCYNLRRVMSILGHKGLQMALKRVKSAILAIGAMIERHVVRFNFSIPQPS